MRWGKPVTVDDDAGQPVAVQWLDWRNHAGGLTKVDEARRELAMRLMPSMNFMREPITKKSLGRFARFFGPVILFWVVIGLGTSFLPRTTWMAPWLLPAVIGGCVALSMQFFIGRELKRDPKESVNTALAEGCCAGCLYALADLRTPEMTTCPECGAAWKTERIGSMRGSTQSAAAPVGVGQGLVDGETSAPRERSAIARWFETIRLANTPVIADACERRVRLVDGKVFSDVDARTASLTDEQREKAKRAMATGRTWSIILAVLFALLMLPAVFVNVMLAKRGIPTPGFAGLQHILLRLLMILAPLFGLFMMMFQMYPAIRGWRPRNAPKAARMLADAYVCPCCGGTLTNVEADAKGNRTCAACQSAWQTDVPKTENAASVPSA